MSVLPEITRLLWRAERRWFLAGIAASMATVLAGMALLGLSGWFIAASALAGAAGMGLSFDFFRPSAGIRFLALGRTASRYAERLVTHDATLRILAVLRVDLFRKLSGFDSTKLARLRGAELLQRLTSDVDALDNLYLRIVLPLAVFVLAGVGLVLALLPFGIAISILVGALLACGFATVLTAGYVSCKDSRRRAIALEALRVRTVDLVRAQGDLAVAGRLAAQQRLALKAATALAEASRGLMAVEIVFGSALSLLSSSFLLAAFLIAGERFRTGSIDGPQLVLIVLVTFAVLETIGPMRRGAIEFGRTMFAARRLAPLLRAIPAAKVQASPTLVTSRAASISVDNVEFRYAADRSPVLIKCTLEIAAGERIALIGASGSGKSTLLAILAGLLEPTAGGLFINDHPADRIHSAARLRSAGLLTQWTELFRDTIAGNLRIAAPEADDAALWAALQTVELDHKVRGLPDGLHARLGESGAGLSGGEARRLALARIVLKSCPLWLLDEPTAGLDDVLATRVLRNVMARAGPATVIIAAHHQREVACADRTIEITSRGTLDPDQSSARRNALVVSVDHADRTSTLD